MSEIDGIINIDAMLASLNSGKSFEDALNDTPTPEQIKERGLVDKSIETELSRKTVSSQFREKINDIVNSDNVVKDINYDKASGSLTTTNDVGITTVQIPISVVAPTALSPASATFVPFVPSQETTTAAPAPAAASAAPAAASATTVTTAAAPAATTTTPASATPASASAPATPAPATPASATTSAPASATPASASAPATPAQPTPTTSSISKLFKVVNSFKAFNPDDSNAWSSIKHTSLTSSFPINYFNETITKQLGYENLLAKQMEAFDEYSKKGNAQLFVTYINCTLAILNLYSTCPTYLINMANHLRTCSDKSDNIYEINDTSKLSVLTSTANTQKYYKNVIDNDEFNKILVKLSDYDNMIFDGTTYKLNKKSDNIINAAKIAPKDKDKYTLPIIKKHSDNLKSLEKIEKEIDTIEVQSISSAIGSDANKRKTLITNMTTLSSTTLGSVQLAATILAALLVDIGKEHNVVKKTHLKYMILCFPYIAEGIVHSSAVRNLFFKQSDLAASKSGGSANSSYYKYKKYKLKYHNLMKQAKSMGYTQD
jgi:hypothetical protein